MALYKIGKKLEYIKEKPFKLEKEIQILTEQNLKLIFNLEFVKSEFRINAFRVDTLSFDEEAKSFTIIEYKRDKNFSVVDQGYAYLSLMLNNKADFILEYNENKEKTLKRNDVDWSQSKVIFVSPSFTKYQREAINFKDLPIELWEIKRYDNDTVSYEQVQKTNATESIKTISLQNESTDKVTDELKVITEEDHIQKSTFSIREVYEHFKGRVINFGDNITVNAKKHTIGFKVEGKIFCDVIFLSKSLKIYLNLKIGELEDAKQIVRNVSNVGHWGNGDYEIKIKDLDDIEYILSLIKQSYRKNKLV